MASHSAPTRANGDCVILQVRHAKDQLRKVDVSDENGTYTIYRLMPVVQDWPAQKVPDGPNPRSHEDECLRSSVAKAIRETLIHAPEDFQLANRGGCLLAESLKFDPERELVTISLEDLSVHGMADGATSNKVIAEVQEDALTTDDPDVSAALRDSLGRARFNVEVVVGLSDHDRIMSLVRGRNTSIQVRPWSLADFDHKFDWIKDIIDRKDGPFQGKVGWDENSGKPVSVLDLISLMTLFHPVYDNAKERRKRTPTIAFSNKGTSDKRLVDDQLAAGFRQLRGVLPEILDLYEYIYAEFHPVYERFCKEYKDRGAKLAKRKGFVLKETTLPLTGRVSGYRIDKGMLFPLLASFRCLLNFDSGEAEWRVDPKAFFDDLGVDLMAVLFELYEMSGRNPATVGKQRAVYAALHDQARILLSEKLREGAETAAML
jgi:hypothetical protein